VIVTFYRSPRFQSTTPQGFRDKSQWQVHVAVATETFNKPVLLAFPPLVLMLLHVYMRANARESGNDRPVGRYRSLCDTLLISSGWYIRRPSGEVLSFPPSISFQYPRVCWSLASFCPRCEVFFNTRGASEGCFRRRRESILCPCLSLFMGY